MSDCCSTCTHEFSPIPGDGPFDAKVLLIGERPGKNENDRHRVFVGASGIELDETYLPLGGLSRRDVRIENCVQCWALGNRTPKPHEIESCAGYHLPSILTRINPEVIILLGASAKMIVDQPIVLDRQHGRPFWGSVLGGVWEGWVFPTYHPAAGLREGVKMSALLEDFETFAQWRKGLWKPLQPATTELDYQVCETPNDLMDYLVLQQPVVSRRNPVWFMGTDTENHGRDPFCIQVSHTPHTGRMIYANNQAVVRSFASWARETLDSSSKISIDGVTPELHWLFHFAQHDMDEMRRNYFTDIAPFTDKWECTMQEAYHFGTLPQALKSLAYRLLGVTMTSWEDTVWPASIEAVTEWMQAAVVISECHPDMQDEVVTEMARLRCQVCGHQHSKGECKKCGCDATEHAKIKREWFPKAASGVLKHVLRYTTNPKQDVEKPYHPWKKLGEIKVDGLRGKVPEQWEWDYLEEQIGPMPILGIGNCTPEQAKQYSVGDADHTLQVGMELVKRRELAMGEGGRLFVYPDDYDR